MKLEHPQSRYAIKISRASHRVYFRLILKDKVTMGGTIVPTVVATLSLANEATATATEAATTFALEYFSKLRPTFDKAHFPVADLTAMVKQSLQRGLRDGNL